MTIKVNEGMYMSKGLRHMSESGISNMDKGRIEPPYPPSLYSPTIYKGVRSIFTPLPSQNTQLYKTTPPMTIKSPILTYIRTAIKNIEYVKTLCYGTSHNSYINGRLRVI